MSWAENLLDASFRGVPLQIESESMQWQRALSEHGTPFKDGDRVKDLGRGARRFPMQVVVFGVNYEIELQNILRTLNTPGTGELIHPIYGSLNVVSNTGEVKHHAERPDYAEISILFVEDTPDAPFSSGNLSSSISAYWGLRTNTPGRMASLICSGALTPWSARFNRGSVAAGLG